MENMTEKDEIMTPGKVTENYDAEQIQVLEGLEAVKKDRVCISDRQVSADCTIWFTR